MLINDIQNYWSMKMRIFLNKTQSSKSIFVWKTLIVLFLSILLLVPTPALAYSNINTPEKYNLEKYNSNEQNYVSNIRTQLDSILASLKKLSLVSYKNGQETLAGIDTNLQKIQSNVEENASKFKNLSNEFQKEYEKYLGISKNISKIGNPPLNAVRNVGSDFVYGLERKYDLDDGIKYLYTYVINSYPYGREALSEVLSRGACYEDYSYYPYACDSLEEAFSISEIPKLIIFSNKTYSFYDNFAKRINLARQKATNVKDYAEDQRSFSNIEVLAETIQLDNFIMNLTKDIPNTL